MAGIACGGAADASNEPIEEVSEEALTSPTLSLAPGTAAGTFTATDAPVLTAGAQGDFACKDPFANDGAVRVTCARGSETLEIIYRAAAKTALAIHRPKGPKVDKRAFFTCKVKGRAGSADLPASLECTGVTPRSRNVGGLGSALDSDIAGIDIGNAHRVGAGGLLLRGMAPRIARIRL